MDEEALATINRRFDEELPNGGTGEAYLLSPGVVRVRVRWSRKSKVSRDELFDLVDKIMYEEGYVDER